MRGAIRALVAPLLLAATACTQTFDATSLGVPVIMASAPGDLPAGKPFKATAHTLHTLFGLVTVSQANLKKALATQLVGGEQVANLKIRSRSRWWDVVVTAISVGLLVPKTVTYEGVIIGR